MIKSGGRRGLRIQSAAWGIPAHLHMSSDFSVRSGNRLIYEDRFSCGGLSSAVALFSGQEFNEFQMCA